MRILTCLFLLLFFLSCQDIKEVPKPEKLIPKEKMIDVLTEVSLLHGARSYNRDLLEEKGIQPDTYIYEKYDIDSVQFLKSNEYYAQNYEEYQVIFTAVKERLEALRVQYDSLREREERRRDSLRDLEKKDTLTKDSIPGTIRDSLILNGGQPDSLKGKLPPPILQEDSLVRR